VLNSEQKRRLLLGMVITIGLGVYPPWKEFGAHELPLKFAPIFQPPGLQEASAGATKIDLDFSRLTLELGLSLAATLALVFMAKGRPEGPVSFNPSQVSSLANTVASVSPLKEPAKAPTSENVYVVDLPKDYYLGEIYLESKDDPDYWEEYVSAKGNFSLPKGRKVQLELAKDMSVDLSFLSRFPKEALYSLDASQSKISDDDLVKLAGVSALRELDLSGTQIGAGGMNALKALPKLEKLWLDRTGIDETTLPVITGLTNLKKLSLTGTKLNPLALENLKKDLSACVVELEESEELKEV
jgi:hypothetical protein